MNFITKTKFDEDIEKLTEQLDEVTEELAWVRQYRTEFIIVNKLYRPMDEFEEAWNSVFDPSDRWPNAIVELVVKFDDEPRKKIVVMDDAGTCEYPTFRNGRIYWNTFEKGIWKYDDAVGKYYWIVRGRKRYFDILGFVSICDELSTDDWRFLK